MDSFKQLMLDNKDRFARILPFDLHGQNVFHLDLSVDNQEIYEFDILDTEKMGEYVQQKLMENECLIAVGGYGEDRLVYRRSPHFGQGENARSIHLGIDVWCEAMTPVYAPLKAKVHSFQDNDQYGDYGPTVILQHHLEEHVFYTLYGHLARRSLADLSVGMQFDKGEKFAEIGDVHENGQWPPHLHFQVVRDMKDYRGDFPGVASKIDKEAYLELCPDPFLILKK